MSYASKSLYVARSRKRQGVSLGGAAILRAKGLNDAQNAQLEEVAGALRRLTAYEKRGKNVLSGKAQRDFQTVVAAVALLRGTEHYDRLKQMIVDTFAARPYDIGTVGAHFVNCLDSTSRDACAASCVGNLILDDGTEDVCPVRVFALKYDGSTIRTLLAVNDAPESTRAIVYIYLDASRKLGGLTASEIETLRNMGVKEVNVYYYDPQTYEQVPITSTYVAIDSLEPVARYAPDSNSNLLVALLGLLLLVIVVCVIWRMAAKKKI